MSVKTAENAIVGAFATAWGVRTPVAYPNANFDKPNPAADWARIAVDGNVAANVGFGAGLRTRDEGLIFIQIFALPGEGTAGANDHAQFAVDAMQNKRFARSGELDVRTRKAVTRRVGNTSDGYYQVNVTIPFEYDEVNS